jgi:hypothetical protein
MDDIYLISGCVLVVMGIDDWLKYRESHDRRDMAFACIGGLLGVLNLYAWIQ